MAKTIANNYITKLAKYLKQPGTPPDLTVKFGDKVYKIHKVLACAQSEWFSKAVDGSFKEGQTGVITLEDDSHFGNAIGCMMTFFYDAQYSTGTGVADVLHAQVCAIAAKYMCDVLFDYAEASFSQMLRDASYNPTADWIKSATLVYDFLSTDLPSHLKMRESVAYPIHRHRLDNVTQEIRNFLRSRPLAAADVLFESQNTPIAQRLFKCPHCVYAHYGPETCSSWSRCPKCGNDPSAYITGGYQKYKLNLIHRCSACGGMHNGDP